MYQPQTTKGLNKGASATGGLPKKDTHTLDFDATLEIALTWFTFLVNFNMQSMIIPGIINIKKPVFIDWQARKDVYVEADIFGIYLPIA